MDTNVFKLTLACLVLSASSLLAQSQQEPQLSKAKIGPQNVDQSTLGKPSPQVGQTLKQGTNAQSPIKQGWCGTPPNGWYNPISNVIEIPTDKKSIENREKLKASLAKWEVAKQECGGNYTLEHSRTSMIGPLWKMTLTVRNNQVIKRVMQTFERKNAQNPAAQVGWKVALHKAWTYAGS